MHFQPHIQLAALAVAATSVGALPLVGGGADESANIHLPGGGDIQESGGASITLPKRIVFPPGTAPAETPVTLPNGIRPEILAGNGKRNAATPTFTGETIQGTVGPFAGNLKIGPDGKIVGSFDTPFGDTTGSVQLKRAAPTSTFTGETIKGTIGPFSGDLTIGPDGKITGSFDSPLGGTKGGVQLRRDVENGANGGVNIDGNEGIHLPIILPRDAAAYINPKFGLGPEIPPEPIVRPAEKRAEPGATIAVDTPVVDLNGDLHLKRSSDIETGGSVSSPYGNGNGAANARLPIIFDA